MRDDRSGGEGGDAAQLRGDDALLRLILESATDYAIFTTDPDGVVTSWPAGAQAVFGYAPAEMLGRSASVMFTPEDRARGEDRTELERARAQGCSEDERWHLRKDGGLVFMNGSVRPLFGEDGALRGFLKIAREETGRRQSNEALQGAERRLETVLNNASVAIFQMDDRQQCVYMNAAAEALTGFTLAETRGRPLHDLIHHTRPDGRPYPLSECPIDQALPENNQEQGEEIFVHKDGGFYPVAFTASPLRDAVGKPVGTIIEVRGTAEEKAAEAALREQQRRESFLLELGDRLRGLTDASAATAVAAEALGRHLGVSRVGYGEVDASGQTISVERDWTDGTVATLAGESRPLDSFGPAIIAELRAGRTLRLDDIAADPRSAPYADAYASVGTRAFLVVPLIKDGRLVAVLYLHEPKPRRWTDGEALLAEDVAERTWAALEKARAEAALRASEARFRTLADNIAQLAWMTDESGAARWYNQRWYDYTGTTFEDMQGWGWKAVHHPDHLDRVVERFSAAVAAGQPWEDT
ncbi:MAG: PAS domain S-box protein, partial [Pseudomonadota bacterium]|nr:PAS domain S-box protein [Pseudomonadota bacterium]